MPAAESIPRRRTRPLRSPGPATDRTISRPPLADAVVGKQYVTFDGRLIPTDETGLAFDGWHATHKLDFVPQMAALKDKSIIKTILSNVEYWESHALGD